MGTRINKQAPDLRLKDSIKREHEKQSKKTLPLNCYGESETDLVKDWNTHLNGKRIPRYKKRKKISFTLAQLRQQIYNMLWLNKYSQLDIFQIIYFCKINLCDSRITRSLIYNQKNNFKNIPLNPAPFEKKEINSSFLNNKDFINYLKTNISFPKINQLYPILEMLGIHTSTNSLRFLLKKHLAKSLDILPFTQRKKNSNKLSPNLISLTPGNSYRVGDIIIRKPLRKNKKSAKNINHVIKQTDTDLCKNLSQNKCISNNIVTNLLEKSKTYITKRDDFIIIHPEKSVNNKYELYIKKRSFWFYYCSYDNLPNACIEAQNIKRTLKKTHKVTQCNRRKISKKATKIDKKKDTQSRFTTNFGLIDKKCRLRKKK